MKILLVVYDNGSYIHYFPLGLAYIAGTLEKHGHEVTIWNQDIHHYKDDELRIYLDNHERFDMVGLSMCGGHPQYLKLCGLSEAINTSKNRPEMYVIGGHMPASDPKYFLLLTKADYVVIGEGEDTIVELLSYQAQRRNEIDGIASRVGLGVTINKRRNPIVDIDKIAFPAWHLFPMDVYRLVRMPNCSTVDFCFPVLSARGCWGKCSFCYRLDPGIRVRSAKSIIEEIEYLQSHYCITYITFGDELLTSSIERTKELCKALIEANVNIKWDCNGRLNYARQDVIELMKRAGCVFINYGIEAFDDEVLKNMNKALTCKQIVEGIENTLAYGISPGFNIIWGNIGDNETTLRKGVDFLLKYDDHSQLRTIRPVTPYPGSPLFDWCGSQGLIKGTWDFYENLCKNSDLFTVDIMGIGLDKSHRLLFSANAELIRNYYRHKFVKVVEEAKGVYFGGKEFKGFRQS